MHLRKENRKSLTSKMPPERFSRIPDLLDGIFHLGWSRAEFLRRITNLVRFAGCNPAPIRFSNFRRLQPGSDPLFQLCFFRLAFKILLRLELKCEPLMKPFINARRKSETRCFFSTAGTSPIK
jgi:hypothetical protein